MLCTVLTWCVIVGTKLIPQYSIENVGLIFLFVSLFEGSRVLFQAAIAMLKLHEDELLKADNAAEIFNVLSTIPAR